MSKKIDDLIESGLKEDSCVLFVGPEFLRIGDTDYNAAFYKTLPDADENDDNADEVNKKNARYNTDEKIWSFKSKDIQDEFFGKLKTFLKKNRNLSNETFLKLAEIPFPLIVSLLPDDTLDAAFSQYRNISHTFKTFFIDSDVPEVSKENILIYNMFGNIKHNEFVTSHADYLNFVMEYAEKKFPPNLKTAFKKAQYFVFVGFEFDKWYNILLLYVLNREKSSSKKYIVREQSTKELLKKLQDSNLKLLFIDGEAKGFIDQLHQKAADAGILRNVMPKDKFILEQMKTNQQTIEETKNLLTVTTNPTEKLRLKMDIEKLESENDKLLEQLKKM